MEVQKVNFVGYYDYSPKLSDDHYYDENGELKDICYICKEKLTEYSKFISNDVNKLYFKEGLIAGVCGHVFHKNCMYEWCGSNVVCPIDGVFWYPERELDSVCELFIEEENCEIKTFEYYDKNALKRKVEDKIENVEKKIENNILLEYVKDNDGEVIHNDLDENIKKLFESKNNKKIKNDIIEDIEIVKKNDLEGVEECYETYISKINKITQSIDEDEDENEDKDNGNNFVDDFIKKNKLLLEKIKDAVEKKNIEDD